MKLRTNATVGRARGICGELAGGASLPPGFKQRFTGACTAAPVRGEAAPLLLMLMPTCSAVRPTGGHSPLPTFTDARRYPVSPPAAPQAPANTASIASVDAPVDWPLVGAPLFWPPPFRWPQPSPQSNPLPPSCCAPASLPAARLASASRIKTHRARPPADAKPSPIIQNPNRLLRRQRRRPRRHALLPGRRHRVLRA